MTSGSRTAHRDHARGIRPVGTEVNWPDSANQDVGIEGHGMRRYLRALIVAYAASMTLLAARWGMQSWSYRRFFDALSQGQGRPTASPGLRSLFLDYGIALTPWE